MKPVIIITIAFVCSVAVLAVLLTIQGIAIYQDQVAFEEYQAEVSRLEAIEREKQQAVYDANRNLCVKVFANKLSTDPEANPYQTCLDLGVEKTIQDACSEFIVNPLGYLFCDITYRERYLEALEELKNP